MSKQYEQYLGNILDECSYIVKKFPLEMTKDEFLNNEDYKRLAENALMRIGEITKKIPADVKVNWSQVQWKKISGMRDKLIHDYLGTDYSIVWDVVKNEIPRLKATIETIIS